MIFQLSVATVIGNELALSFTGGLEIYIFLSVLRRGCPCASCRGEPDAMGRVLSPVVEYGPRAFELVRYVVIGGYALQPFWADGHSTGIYSHSYLIRLGGHSNR